MELWNTFRSQIVALWKDWSLQQRIMISGAAVACLAAVFGTLFWATRQEYQVIASDLSPQKAFQIMGSLENAQIDAKTNFGSTSVSVPRSQVGEARMALKDIVEPSAVDADDPLGGFGATPAQEHDRRLRKLEARIARSIEQLRDVDSATVLITLPPQSPFVVDRTPPTASVTVTPSARGRLTNQVGNTIVMQVARAVEGLTPDNVILTDTNGNQFSAAGGPGGSGMSGQLEFQRSVELDRAMRAESILVSMLGEGKAQVRVTADIDFRETNRVETIFDPEGKVKTTENTESITSGGGNSFGDGVPGRPKIGDGESDLSGGGKFVRESSTVDYDHARTSVTTTEMPGSIKRLTVAAIVDLGGGQEGDANTVASAGTVNAEQVEGIIRQAVGFDDSRGDEVAVTIAPLNGIFIEPETPAVLTVYQEYKPLVESVLVGLAATVAFLIAVLALRKIRPVVVPAQTDERFTREDYRRMAVLAEKAQSHPDLAAHVISSWMGQAAAEKPSEGTRTPRSGISRAA